MYLAPEKKQRSSPSTEKIQMIQVTLIHKLRYLRTASTI